MSSGGKRGTVVPLRKPPSAARQVVECARRVHAELGPGLEREIYARALALELHAARIAYRRDATVEVRYRGSNVGRVLLDFQVDGLAVALHAGPSVPRDDRVRLAAAAVAAGAREALALAFGAESLEAHSAAVSG